MIKSSDKLNEMREGRVEPTTILNPKRAIDSPEIYQRKTKKSRVNYQIETNNGPELVEEII